ncbi:PAS domain S-box-containing protein [Catenuloplanes nepalensis]|uniref:Sensor-like histidine kinase SenX3 n=1 Tax=Catenuloplanes nepalensis TaxID=587533 RepID=A0ABT9MSE2_9ACTN|nr:ATP-binding protein [Catenuloplanes nepalensis]MDP9794178.1 PAS domain S-box-containing protein [Catenuloplanes nepalensis]
MNGWKRLGIWRSATILTGVVGVFGMSVAVGVAGVVAAEQRQSAQEQLQRRASVVTARVAAEARRYTDSVSMAAAALGWRETLTAKSFAEVAEPIARMRLPGASSVVFLAAADSDGVNAAQRLWRSRGATDLVLTPAATGGEHLFSIFSQPLDDAPPARTGVDLAQAPAPSHALREARDGRRIIVSDAYHLLRDRSVPAAARQLSFVVTAPVLAPAGADGRRAFRGWVLMGLRGQDFIGVALREASQDLVDVTLRAHTTTGTADIAALRAAVDGRRDLAWQANVRIANRSWTLRFAAAGLALPGGRTGLPTSLAAGGALTSLLLAGLVWVLATGRARAQAQVTSATARLQSTADELAGQKDYLAQILDAVHVTILTCDTDGRLVHTNSEGRTRIGDIDRRLVTDLLTDLHLVHPDGTAYVPGQSPLLRALGGEDVHGEEVIRILPDGSRRHLITHSRALHTPSGQRAGAVSSSFDVTTLREREAELAAFAGIVAHDLKNPLTSLTGYTEIVADDLAGLPGMGGQVRMLGRVLATGARMRRLIDDLLAFAAARDGAVRPADVDLSTLVDQVVEERLATSREAVPQIFIGALDGVYADAAMVRQLVDNLIGNAIKYTPPGQPARVDVTTADAGDGWIRVEVADRGIGIPAGQHQAVFNDFHRAHPAAGYTGTGLGLAICRRIVTRHGGAIGVTDNPGGGARFWFTLPAAAWTAPEDVAQVQRAAAAGLVRGHLPGTPGKRRAPAG